MLLNLKEKCKKTYGDIQIKQHSDVKYLGWLLNETMSGETTALIAVSKINNNLKFFSRKNSFLTTAMRWLVCNALVPPHFSYVCSVWYPNLREKLKHRTQTTQNKCICFWLTLNKLKHISHQEFERLNWLPVTYKFKQVLRQSFLSISIDNILIIWMKSLQLL